MANDMKIVLTDETSDGRFLKSNTADNSVKTATQTKTEIPVTGGSTPTGGKSIVNALGSQALNTMSNGSFSQASSMLTSMTNPVAIATTALTIANKVYNEWKKGQQELQQQSRTLLQAGGPDRGNVNMMNRKINPFTNRGSGTYVRR